jgi:FkbM family methyltransferase
MPTIHTIVFRIQHLGISTALSLTVLHALARRHIIPEILVVVRSRGFEHPISIRLGTSDLLVYQEIMRDKKYATMLNLPHTETIVDLGANIGLVSAYFLSNYPDSRLVAVEADPSNFELCQINLKHYGDRAELANVAVWSSNGHVQLRRFSDYWATQTEPVNNPSETIVPARDMRTIVSTFNVERIDILKVDIEGAESELFHGDTDWLDRVTSIVIELHGAECEKAFLDALNGYRYIRSSSGELTICMNLSKANRG